MSLKTNQNVKFCNNATFYMIHIKEENRTVLESTLNKKCKHIISKFIGYSKVKKIIL
jgi:hypothetical protein